MAKQIDLSGLKKQPIKKTSAPKIEDVVHAIHRTPEPVEEKEVIKRITLDLPASLHTRLKLRTVQEQTTIRNFVLQIIEQVLED
jgi:hypothetical protein